MTGIAPVHLRCTLLPNTAAQQLNHLLTKRTNVHTDCVRIVYGLCTAISGRKLPRNIPLKLVDNELLAIDNVLDQIPDRDDTDHFVLYKNR